MIETNALIISFDEITNLIRLVSNDNVSIEIENNQWFYVSTDNYDTDNILKELSKKIGKTISFILIDTTTEDNNCVAIICR